MAAALALLLVCGLPVLASDGDRGNSAGNSGGNGNGGNGGGGDGGGGFNADNETIGTLPIVRPGGNQVGTMEPLTGLDVLGFDLSLELPTTLVSQVVVDAWGEGNVVWEDVADGVTRLTFQGDVTVVLDETLATSNQIRSCIDYGIGFRGGEAAYLTPAWASPVIALTGAGSVALPLARLGELGLLADGLQVHADSPFFGEQSQIDFRVHNGLVSVIQLQ